MIRFTLIMFVVGFLAAYACRDWYKSACGLVVLCAFVERPDMPKEMFGVTGLNPWNVLLLVIVIAWLFSRGREGLKWQLPRHMNLLLALYFAVILVGVARMLQGMDAIVAYAIQAGAPIQSRQDLITDTVINSIKWVVPGLLLCDGCRDQKRLLWAVGALVMMYFLLSVQVLSFMPVSGLADGSSLSNRAVRVLDAKLGYHRVDLAALLAGGSWAILTARALTRNPHIRLALLGMFGVSVLGLALTGGRTGYATWIVIGAMLGFLRWRKILFLAPIAVFIILSLVPAARDRMLQGFDNDMSERRVEQLDRLELDTDGAIDLHAITSGRVLVWPFVIEGIMDSPYIGHGRMAMQTQGISALITDTYGRGTTFRHPHNAYLELLLDNGVIGALPVLLLFGLLLVKGLRYFRDGDSAILSTVGVIALVIMTSQLIASLGSQSFYPRVGVVTMWCAIGLLLRVWSDHQSKVFDWSNETLDARALRPAPLQVKSKFLVGPS